MADHATLDFSGWEVYCQKCATYRIGRISQERDIFNRTQYFELVCNGCHSILLTCQRSDTLKRLNEHTPN